MCKVFGLFIITILSTTAAYAQQEGQIYMSPTPSTYSTTDNSRIQIIDTSIQNELTQYSIRRQRLQEANFVSMDGGASLQADTFVFKRIFDRSLSRFMKSDYFKKTSVGRASETVKRNTEADINYVDPTNNIKHKFDFKIAAFQQQAFIQYSGYTNVQLAYNMNNNGLALIYRKDVGRNKFLGLQNTFSGVNAGQYLTFNYNW